MGVSFSSTLIGIADTHCTELQDKVDSDEAPFPVNWGLKYIFQHEAPSNLNYSMISDFSR